MKWGLKTILGKWQTCMCLQQLISPLGSEIHWELQAPKPLWHSEEPVSWCPNEKSPWWVASKVRNCGTCCQNLCFSAYSLLLILAKHHANNMLHFAKSRCRRRPWYPWQNAGDNGTEGVSWQHCYGKGSLCCSVCVCIRVHLHILCQLKLSEIIKNYHKLSKIISEFIHLSYHSYHTLHRNLSGSKLFGQKFRPGTTAAWKRYWYSRYPAPAS